MPTIREITVYKFDELQDKAKEKARDWFRGSAAADDYWSEYVIEDAQQIAKFMGITFATRGIKTCGGKTISKPSVWWSGFSSQGDGACFEGTWTPADVKLRELKQHAPTDKALHDICRELRDIGKRHKDAAFVVKHSGHYSHEYCTSFDFDGDLDGKTQAALIKAARDFMRWIYRQLEAAWDYENEDATVDENIRVNEYEFCQSGKLSCAC